MKIAILTGANGQLGKSYLDTLVSMNYFVYAIDLNIDGIKDSKNIKSIKLDITDENKVHDFYRNINKVELIINN